MEEQSPKTPGNSDDSAILERKKQDQMLINFLLATLFAFFLLFYLRDFVVNHKISSFLYVIQISITVILFITRSLPQKISMRPFDWFVALGGTWIPLLIWPSGETDITILVYAQLIAICISILGILSLNKSIGIVPALRKVKTGGLYRLIRHPIYLSYFIGYSCIVIQNPNILNVVILGAVIMFDILRIISEEKFLRQDSSYQEYMQKVKWRLLPFIW